MRDNTVAHAPARADLPTGVLTFFFTDIEDSSRLVQSLGARFRDLIATHDAVMRRAAAPAFSLLDQPVTEASEPGK